MSRARIPLLLALAALAAGCVEFVDPVGLKLAEDTRLSVLLTVTDDPRFPCGPAGVAPADSAELAAVCVQGTLRPGRDRTGRRFPLLTDTLYALGQPVVPEPGPDSTLVYRFRATLPLSRLSETALTLRLPRVEGSELPVPEIRWFAVEPLGPDTITRRPDETVALALELPAGRSVPAPSGSWTTRVSGSRAESVYVGYDLPPDTLRFPPEVLDPLGGPRFFADFGWNRVLSAAGPGVQLSVFMVQQLRWTVLPALSAGTGS